MITLPTGIRIWIIAGITDMRCGQRPGFEGAVHAER